MFPNHQNRTRYVIEVSRGYYVQYIAIQKFGTVLFLFFKKVVILFSMDALH